jgi:polar amino acid transport system permease protein
LRNCLPSLASQTASLIKDSSLLSIIAVTELTHVAQEINAFTYSTLESYLPLAFAYLLLTAPLSFLTRRWEKSLAYAN